MHKYNNYIKNIIHRYINRKYSQIHSHLSSPLQTLLPPPSTFSYQPNATQIAAIEHWLLPAFSDFLAKLSIRETSFEELLKT